jgi:hypothetical protein
MIATACDRQQPIAITPLVPKMYIEMLGIGRQMLNNSALLRLDDARQTTLLRKKSCSFSLSTTSTSGRSYPSPLQSNTNPDQNHQNPAEIPKILLRKCKENAESDNEQKKKSYHE